MSASFDIAAFAYAHRGLWGRKADENSLPAFQAAAAAGVGCELDVRALKDGTLVVFHDATLDRMCNDPRRLDAITAEELAVLHLPDGSHIPTLEQALDAMDDLPVLIELKINAPGSDLADRVATALSIRKGRCTVMSFDEPTVDRLRKLVTHRPVGQLIEGQMIEGLSQTSAEAAMAKAKRAIALGVDYLAPHVSALETVAAVAGGLPLVTWTVRDPAQLGHARIAGAAPIFEGFPADLAKQHGTPI
ncbi:MAG: glycerophosphodiester phosphodiesterase family protein [Alphaproteobacteria bacterium]